MKYLFYIFVLRIRKRMTEKIIILDCGSQVTMLIGRRLRELNVFCEIYPFNKIPVLGNEVRGVIISGSPCSVRDPNAPQIDLSLLRGRFPLLGICYGAQYLAHSPTGIPSPASRRGQGALLRPPTSSMPPFLSKENRLMPFSSIPKSTTRPKGSGFSRISRSGSADARGTGRRMPLSKRPSATSGSEFPKGKRLFSA